MEKNTEEQKTEKTILTFTVAECGEYHNLGRYYEGIKTLEEAYRLYQLCTGTLRERLNLKMLKRHEVEVSHSGKYFPDYFR